MRETTVIKNYVKNSDDLVFRRKYILAKKNISQAFIAKKCGVARSLVSMCVNGKKASSLCEVAIVYFTRQKYEYLFGTKPPRLTAKRAEMLRDRLGLVFCPNDSAHPYKKIAECGECGQAVECRGAK